MAKARARVSNNGRHIAQAIRTVKREVQVRMRERAAQLTDQGQGLLFLGLDATVYATAPGRYARTQHLARGAHFKVTAGTRGMINFRAWNTQPYAREVEFGTFGGRADEVTAASRAAMPGAQPTPLVTGRSGEQWTLASLAHTRALVWTMMRLRLDVKAAMIRSWNRQ